ncbi:MAG: XdhC family protein [Chloroflexi bacterium]|nr:XdhC family protein [Chloroflexota bacterium]
MDIFKSLIEFHEKGIPVAMVTVIDAERSTPREEGSRMLVLEDGRITGTVGGGRLEAESIKEALAALKEGKCRRRELSFNPSDEGSIMICGGRAEIFVEVFLPGQRVIILGAGHVGQKVADVCSAAGIPHQVGDDRAEFANKERFPHAGSVVVAPFEEILEKFKVDKDVSIVIVTRGHKQDNICLKEALKTDAGYIGMIGSRNKVASNFRDLEKEGVVGAAGDPRVYAPIGLQLGDKTPGQIAVSIVGEILKARSPRKGVHMRETLNNKKIESDTKKIPEDASWV